MKIMKWRGYKEDDAVVADITALSAQYSKYARVCVLLQDLQRGRVKLCIFHVSKVFTMMRVASSIAESTHSSIKGGCEFKRMLRTNNFYETMLHILQLMRIYIDDTVEDLKNFASKGWKYSPYARKFVDHAWSGMAHCSSTLQISETQWRVVQNVPAFTGGKDQTAYTLPAYTQTHEVTFHSDKTHATCTCPEYTQGLRLCAAVCAVLFQQGRATKVKDVSMLHPCWHLANHPLLSLVNDSSVTFGRAMTMTLSAPLPQEATPLSLLPNDVVRLTKLQSAFHDVLHDSLKSPHFERLLHSLLTQKQLVAGQSLDHELALPPTSAVAAVYMNSGNVPHADVSNKSPLARVYNREHKNRVQTAQSRDPTSYTLHKRGIEGAQITCDCGESLLNTKRTRHYHVHHNKRHLEWRKEVNNAADSDVTERVAVPTNAQADSDVLHIQRPLTYKHRSFCRTKVLHTLQSRQPLSACT